MKKKMSLLVALVFAVVLTSYSVSGTYAKYTSQADKTDSARVAKWDVKVNGKRLTQTEKTFTFNLFETIKDTDGTLEGDVLKVTNENIIAPGTQGSFDIVLNNNSEVTAKYAINYTVTKSNIPVEFSVDNGTTWTADLANVVADDTDTRLDMTTGTKTITVMWRWAFDGANSVNYNDTQSTNAVQTDGTDTDLGLADTAAVLTVKADVTISQVD